METLSNRKYFRECRKCQQEIIIEQKGEELPEELIEKILEVAHVHNHYDFFSQYVKLSGKTVKINAEIYQPGQCQNF